MYKIGIVKLENSGIELLYSGILNKEESSVGISEWFEIDTLNLFEGNLLDYTDWCASKGKDALQEIERLILEQINNS